MMLCLCDTPGKYSISPVLCNLIKQVLMLRSEIPVAFVNNLNVVLSCHASLVPLLPTTSFAFNMKYTYRCTMFGSWYQPQSQILRYSFIQSGAFASMPTG